jgi:hypothetical protein
VYVDKGNFFKLGVEGVELVLELDVISEDEDEEEEEFFVGEL